MSHVKPALVNVVASITGDVAAQEMLKQRNGLPARFSGIDAGGRINLGTATTVKVLVEDQDGVVLHSAAAAVTEDTDIDPVPRGVRGPLKVTTTEISNAAHTVTVTWGIRR